MAVTCHAISEFYKIYSSFYVHVQSYNSTGYFSFFVANGNFT